jgi:hypothetical protein
MALTPSYSNAGSGTFINGQWVELAGQVDQLGNVVTPGGSATVAIPVDTAANTVVKNSSGRLCRVLITTSAASAVNIYDNASTNSGTIIGAIPANAAVGSMYDFEMPAVNGITVGGGATNPAMTISYY